jgi:hypothetical protein
VRQHAHRYWNPDKHGVAPDRDGLDQGPTLADRRIAQDGPERQGHADSIRVHEPDGRAQQGKVVLDRIRGNEGDEGVGEGGRDEEGEDERRERPEGLVEVGRGREVEGGVCYGEGIEGVDSAKEDLK